LTFYADVSAILLGGTFVNYGSTPKILEEGYENRSRAPQTAISINEESIEPSQDHDGNILYERQIGLITIWAKNKTDRDNMEEDVKGIYNLSNDSGEITGIERESYQNRYEASVRIERLSGTTEFTGGSFTAVNTCPFTVKKVNGQVLFHISCSTNIPSDDQVLAWDDDNGYAIWVDSEELAGMDAVEFELTFDTDYREAYKEFTYDGNDNILKVEIWDDSGKALLLWTLDYVFSGDELQTITKEYNPTGQTLVITYTWSGGLLQTTSRALSGWP